MKATAVPLLELFDRKMRLEVPLFQRQYVWSREQQWEPLWEDVARKFTDFIEGRLDGPVHFLGAMVLAQKQTPVVHLERRQVIDGQQRLTTLQILLAVLRDFCQEQGCDDLTPEFERHTLNAGKLVDPKIDQFKVWPTQLDRACFMDVMTLRSRQAVELRHPQIRQRYARSPDPRPRIIEAYLYFSEAVRRFFLGADGETPVGAELSLHDRLDLAFQAMKSALHVVAIDLDEGDDPQVIFETLNARGEPLLPADLLRNYIFLRAGRDHPDYERLYEQYWRGFDDEFWRTTVTQGRLSRPRSDLFMQHFLSSRRAVDIPIKHLYAEYRHWIERGERSEHGERGERPFKSIEEELTVLNSQREDFRRVLEPKDGDPVAPLASFMECFDVRTAYPLMLYLLSLRLGSDEWRRISCTIESYLLRRAVVGWTTKGYNRIFLNLVKQLRKDTSTSPSGVIMHVLSEQSGESSAWPTDEEFSKAWLTRGMYGDLPRSRIVHILTRLNDTFFTAKSERLKIDSELTIEHVMPQSWYQHWPLPDGSKGMDQLALQQASTHDPSVVATIRREQLLQTLGNLTLLTQPLNAAVSNAPWATKRGAMENASLLPINLPFRSAATWDEEAILARGKDLLKRAIALWPAPGTSR
jgi:hypothetical protein